MNSRMNNHFMEVQHLENNRGGYVTLMLVLISGALGVGIAISLILRGIGISRSSLIEEQSAQSIAYAESCAEDAIQQIRNSTPFTGSGSQTFSNGSCSFLVTSQGGENRTIIASSTIQNVYRTISISITQINPKIVISDWNLTP